MEGGRRRSARLASIEPQAKIKEPSRMTQVSEEKKKESPSSKTNTNKRVGRRSAKIPVIYVDESDDDESEEVESPKKRPKLAVKEYKSGRGIKITGSNKKENPTRGMQEEEDESGFSESSESEADFEGKRKKKMVVKKEANRKSATAKERNKGASNAEHSGKRPNKAKVSDRPKNMREAKKKKPLQPWQRRILDANGKRFLIAAEKRIRDFIKMARDLARGRIFEYSKGECYQITREIIKAYKDGRDPVEMIRKRAFPELTNEKGEDSDGSSSEDEWEEMQNFEPLLEKMVQVDIATWDPDEVRPDDVYTLRQATNQFVRETWENVHKAQTLGFIGHLKFVSRCVLKTDLIPGLMLSLLPKTLTKSLEKQLTLPNLQQLVNWYCVEFQDSSSKEPTDGQKKVSFTRIVKLVQTRTVGSDLDASLLFFALIVSLRGIARICMNCQPLFRRWDANVIATLDAERLMLDKARHESDILAFDQMTRTTRDYWVEYWNEEDKRWICIDLVTKTVDKPEGLCQRTSVPITYVFALDSEGGVSEVAQRYAPDYVLQEFRRRRTNQTWLCATLRLPVLKTNEERCRLEKIRMQEDLLCRPLPTTLKALKNHPLYVLERDLLKYEGIYPPPKKQKPLGSIRGFDVFPRSTVFNLLTERDWTRLARSIKRGEKPYKVVRTYGDPRAAGYADERLYADLFGFWQTETFRAPAVKNGRIPCDRHGNVLVFRPHMCPKGAVHLKLSGLIQVARKLDKECRPVIVGYDKQAWCQNPVFEGACVLEKDKEIFEKGWEKFEAERSAREAKKREDRVNGNWKKLIRGIVRLNYVNKKFGGFGLTAKEMIVKKKTSTSVGVEEPNDEVNEQNENAGFEAEQNDVPVKTIIDNTPNFANLAPMQGFSLDDLMNF